MQLERVPHLLYEPEDTGILWIKFNRPEKMNALASDSAIKLVEYMRAGDDDPNIRVIVVTGVGRAFCAGIDIGGGGGGTRERPRWPDTRRKPFRATLKEPIFRHNTSLTFYRQTAIIWGITTLDKEG